MKLNEISKAFNSGWGFFFFFLHFSCTGGKASVYLVKSELSGRRRWWQSKKTCLPAS